VQFILNPQIADVTFDDFEALCEMTKGWNLELSKLDTTPFCGKLFQLAAQDLSLMHFDFNCHLKQKGEPPKGLQTIAIPSSPEFRIFWRNQYVTGNSIMVFPYGGDLQAISDPSFNVYSLGIDQMALFKKAEALGFPDFEQNFLTAEVHQCKPDAMNHIRKTLCKLTRMTTETEISAMRESILFQLAYLIATASTGHTLPSRKDKRIELLRQADQCIISNPDEPVTVHNLSETTGVSKRTLQYAFGEFYGVTPKAYITAVRLNAVRKLLKHSTSKQRVADAANAWGFWHMGKFAADYRKLFGENPSETLRSCVVNVG